MFWATDGPLPCAAPRMWPGRWSARASSPTWWTRALSRSRTGYLLDVGPSYVVVAAIAVAVLYGPWLARAAAAADLALLVFVGHIFAGLSQLQVSAVGHATALATGAVLGGAVTWRRHGQRRAPRPDTTPRPVA